MRKGRRGRQPTRDELEKAWEDLCDGCGKCCSIFTPEGESRDSGCGVACPSLDTETNQCTVYKDRHKRETCLPVRPSNVMYLHKQGILPDSCAYVRFMQNKPQIPKRMVSGAKLLPFNLADPDLQQKYILKREAWLNADESGSSPDDQPTSAAP